MSNVVGTMDDEGYGLTYPNKALRWLKTIHGPLAVDNNEWYAIDTLNPGGFKHLFYTVKTFRGSQKLRSLRVPQIT